MADAAATFQVGQRVRIDADPDLAGIVRFIGEVDFTEGKLIGVELDRPHGACDGSHEFTSYFRCDPGRGVFVRAAVLSADSDQDPVGAGTSGSTSWKSADALRQLAIALEERDYRRLLEQLIPEALALGVSSSELQSFARLAREGLALAGREDFASELEDLSPMRRNQVGPLSDLPQDFSLSRVLQQRYIAVQDAMAELTATMAGLRSVILPGCSTDTSNIGKPARVISPLDRPLVGTWSYGGNDNDATQGKFTVCAQVGENTESLLYFEETLQDGRCLACWLGRRDGDWLVGDLCNAFSKDLLGALRIQLRAETGKAQVAVQYRMAGASDWGGQVLADFFSSEVLSHTSKAQRSLAEPPSSRSSRIDLSESSKNADVHSVPAGPTQYTIDKSEKQSGLGSMLPGNRKTSNAASHASSTAGGRNTFFGRLTGKHEAPDHTDRTDAILEAIHRLQEIVQESLREVSVPPIDLAPVLQEVRAGTSNVLEGLKDFEIAEKGDIQSLRVELTRFSEEIKTSARQGGSINFDGVLSEFPKLSEEIKLSTEHVLEGIKSFNLAEKSDLAPINSELPVISEAVSQVRKSIEVNLEVVVKDMARTLPATSPEASPLSSSNGGGPEGVTLEVLQALRSDVSILVKTQEPVQEIREVLLNGTVNVDFTEIKSTIHEYITVMQNTVKNGANMGPVLDTMRKNQKALVKKIEDGPKAKK